MQARRDDHALPRAGVDVDVRIDAALADQLQLAKAFEQWSSNFRPLSDQDQDFGFTQASGRSRWRGGRCA
jgi:hypothetical protein